MVHLLHRLYGVDAPGRTDHLCRRFVDELRRAVWLPLGLLLGHG